MTATAALFPGQGLRPEDCDRSEVEARLPELLAECEHELGVDVYALAQWSTAQAQPAIFLSSLALWTRDQAELRPAAVAGHSLGEITALAAAGAIEARAGLRLVIDRGRLLDRALSGRETGMLALATDVREAEAVIGDSDAAVANDNSPVQVVVAGTRRALEHVSEAAAARDLRAVQLQVSGAFHTSWVTSVVDEFHEILKTVEFGVPRLPVFSSATAARARDPRSELEFGLTNRVRWRETALALAGAGITNFLDVGPGRTPGALARRTVQDHRAAPTRG